jgi:peptidoglycan hydrolase CwlO-like protein
LQNAQLQESLQLQDFRKRPTTVPHSLRRRRAIILAAIGAGALSVGGSTTAPGQSLSARQQSLRAQVAAESRRIAATSAGLADAQRRLAALNARVAQRTAQLRQAQADLVRARVHLTRLEQRADEATGVLKANLVDAYKAGRPNVVNVVLESDGFPDLLNRLSYFRRVQARNAHVLDVVREARAEVAREEAGLERKRARLTGLARVAMRDREQAAVLSNALLRRQQDQIRARNGTAAELRAVQGRINRIERAQAAAARQASAAPTATDAAPVVSDPGSAVAKVIAAANQIATTPYVYGGGHGGSSGGYDCSGSVSYALAAAGLVSGPLTSGGFMSWGLPGPGQHITVYANAGHAYMVVDGRRFDTSALSGGGTRWTSVMRSSAGFVARHPPGL